MALVYCTECGKQISDSAPSCPQCGAVNRAHAPANPAPSDLPPLLGPLSSNPTRPRARTSAKSLTTAALLCFFLGGLSAHRFYVGKPVTALLQIVTIGGLLIWWLVDFIQIVSGNFKDADGLPIAPSEKRTKNLAPPSAASQQAKAPHSSIGGWIGLITAAVLVFSVGVYVVESTDFSVAGSSGQDEPVGTIGDTVQLGDFEVTITKVDVRNAIAASPLTQLGSLSGVGGDELRNLQGALGSDPFGVSEIAPGGSTYAIVEYAYSNIGDRPRAWETPSIDLLDQRGVEQAKDLGARAALDLERSFTAKTFSDLNPGVRVTDAEVFHVSLDRYDPDSWVIKIQVDGRSAVIAIGNWPRPSATVEAPSPTRPIDVDSSPTADAAQTIVEPPSPPKSLDRLRAAKVGQFARIGDVRAALIHVSDIDREMRDYDFTTDNGGCDVRACSGLGVAVFAYTRSGIAPDQGPVTLIAPDGRRVESGGSMDEASPEEYGLDSSKILLSSYVFRVQGTSAAETLESGEWQVEAMIGGEQFVFPLTSEGSADLGEAICCATLAGVSPSDVLNVRSAPDANSTTVVSISPNQRARIAVHDCFGGQSRAGWQSAGPSQAGTTWCLVEAHLDGAETGWARTFGWANASYLRFESAP